MLVVFMKGRVNIVIEYEYLYLSMFSKRFIWRVCIFEVIVFWDIVSVVYVGVG